MLQSSVPFLYLSVLFSTLLFFFLVWVAKRMLKSHLLECQNSFSQETTEIYVQNCKKQIEILQNKGLPQPFQFKKHWATIKLDLSTEVQLGYARRYSHRFKKKIPNPRNHVMDICALVIPFPLFTVLQNISWQMHQKVKSSSALQPRPSTLPQAGIHPHGNLYWARFLSTEKHIQAKRQFTGYWDTTLVH